MHHAAMQKSRIYSLAYFVCFIRYIFGIQPQNVADLLLIILLVVYNLFFIVAINIPASSRCVDSFGRTHIHTRLFYRPGFGLLSLLLASTVFQLHSVSIQFSSTFSVSTALGSISLSPLLHRSSVCSPFASFLSFLHSLDYFLVRSLNIILSSRYPVATLATTPLSISVYCSVTSFLLVMYSEG